MRIHGRTRLLIGVLSLAFAVVLPTTAMAAHDLGIYKVEKHVDLESDETTVQLNCYSGDYALDGMWRIDHADFDEDDTHISFLGRAVDVEWAYPTDANLDNKYEGYNFKFIKNAFGRAQAKVFLTCIRGNTEQANSHSHVIPITKMATTPGVEVANRVDDSRSCGINQFIATPGFKITRATEDPYVGHVERSWPNTVGTYQWVIDLAGDPGATADLYYSCVNRKIPAGVSGEKHKFVYKLQGAETHSLPAQKVRTKRIECKAAYKAAVAGFEFVTPPAIPTWIFADDLGGSWTLPHWWYLGMDPQPKNRDFKFLNSDVAAATNKVRIKSICINYRTT